MGTIAQFKDRLEEGILISEISLTVTYTQTQSIAFSCSINRRSNLVIETAIPHDLRLLSVARNGRLDILQSRVYQLKTGVHFRDLTYCLALQGLDPRGKVLIVKHYTPETCSDFGNF